MNCMHLEAQNQKTLNRQIDDFLFNWHKFTIDYWWRKKYNVPFGSPQHRAMNPIDMLIEYTETLEINRAMTRAKNQRDFPEEDDKVVHLSNEEIDKDYEDLDLENF